MALAQKEAGEWRVFLEPKFLHAAGQRAAFGAKKTVLVGGWWDGQEVGVFTQRDWKRLGVGWEGFVKVAQRVADEDWKRVRVRYQRDQRGVIEYVELRTEEPLMGCIVLGPRFAGRFAETLGEKCLVAVPNRFVAYVFPSLVGAPMRYGREVLRAYAGSAYPVSTELFECAAQGWRAVGEFQRDEP